MNRTDGLAIHNRSWGAVVLGVAIGVACLFGGPARSEPPPQLYQARTIVTGTDLRSRPSGFAECLHDVLVKVSGDPTLLDDPRVSDLAAHAGDLVESFDYVDRMSGIPHHDEQGSSDRPYDLTVRFDPARIDDRLAALGRQPWTAERPAIYPVIRVEGLRPPPYYLTVDAATGGDQRAALAAAAERYALPLALPAAATGSPASFRGPDGTVTVAGTLVFSDAALGWVGSWQLAWQGRAYAWTVRGVSFDEAFRDLVRGAARVLSGHAAPSPG